MKSLSMKTPELLPRTQAEKSWERVFEAHQALWGKWGRGRAYSFLAWSFPLPLALTFPCCMRCLGASQRVSQNRRASNRCSSRHELLPLWIRKKFKERRHEVERTTQVEVVSFSFYAILIFQRSRLFTIKFLLRHFWEELYYLEVHS